MRWEKIIPVVLFLVLMLVGVSEAWQETAALSVLNFDMPQSLHVNFEKGTNFLGLKEIEIYLEPLVPVSHNIEGIICSQQETLKSA